MSDHRHNIWKKVALWVAGIIGGALLLIIALGIGVTLWLTPEKLADLVSEEISKTTKADVKIHNLNYTLWSSFPHLNIKMDSIIVNSRVFDSLPEALKKDVPEDSRLLMKTGGLSGGLNVWKILSKKICLDDISVDGLQLNLVSLNDSLANYMIVPESGKSVEIPYFSAQSIKLNNDADIRFRALQTRTDMKMQVDSLEIVRKGVDDIYHIGLGADADLIIGENRVLNKFPINLNGDVSLAFNPFGLKTTGFGINAGNIPVDMSTALEIDNEIDLKSMDVKINQFNINELMKLIPTQMHAGIGNIDADVDLNAQVILVSPYRAKKGEYPTMKVLLNILKGNISYQSPGMAPVNISDINMRAILDFDGKNPLASRLSVPELKVGGYGADLQADLGLSSFNSSPIITADIHGDVSLDQLSKSFSSVASYSPSGKAKLAATIAFRLMETSKQIDNLRINADAQLNDIALKVPGMINSFKIHSGDISIKNGEKFISLSQMGSFGGDAFDITIGAKGLAMVMNSQGGKTDVKMNSFGLKGKAANILSGSPKGSGNISMQGGNIAYKSDSLVMNIRGVNADLAVTQPAHVVNVNQYDAPAAWTADVSETYTQTTPRILSFNSVQPIISMLSGWNVAAKVKVKEGEILTYSLPVRNRFRGLDMVANMDSVELKSIRLQTAGAALALKGKVSNLRQFLGTSSPAPLYVFLDADVDTVNINRLAAVYEEGLKFTIGENGINKWLNDTTPKSTDSVTLLIPRNIVAQMNASVKRVEYEDIAFNGIGGRISMADGDLRIDTVAIHSDFFNAYGNALLTTRNIQNLSMKAAVNVPEVNLENLFDNFTSLLEKAPELGNLSGYLSATTNLGMRIYPAMVADLPTLYANIALQGRQLQLEQTKFIRRITKTMGIDEDGPLHFDNLNMHAALRDNLMMLYPFRFGMPDYTFVLGGINNLAGEMYYHVGLEESPLPIPFGVNIKGTFKKPEIRFGGAGWKDTNGLPVAGGIMEATYINLPATMRKLNRQFIHKAAEGYEGSLPIMTP